ncbi:MAG: putative transporter [Candidatus Aminicenantes bacterium]|nr:putative transporter [Candidatus Aminicenantes bacterium]
MSWIAEAFAPDSVVQALLILCLAGALGMILGSLRVLQANLGIAGILFVGLVLGHFGVSIHPVIQDFARDLGLILFVYSVGQEVGPGLLASLRKHGLALNALAGFVVLGGGAIALLLSRVGGMPMAAAAGLFAGATSNTPSLAAVQQALKLMPHSTEALVEVPGMAYAVAYPFGVLGIILAIAALRFAFRVDPKSEARKLEALKEKDAPRLQGINLEVRNAEVDGEPVSRIIGEIGGGVVVSRLARAGGPQEVPRSFTTLRLGDILHAVGTPEKLERLMARVGAESPVDVREVASGFTSRRVVVTRRNVIGKSVHELNLRDDYGVLVTRIIRTGQEFSPRPDFDLQYGDVLVIVGTGPAIERLAGELGDSSDRLDQPQVIPIFIGIVLGILLGSVPLHLPGMAVSFRLGLAGGPLIVAIALSRVGRLGPLVWHMPLSANLMLRNIGISLFLACVGLKAGEGFVATLLDGGLYWIFGGALITLVPLILATLAARFIFRIDFLSVAGFMAGSMTNPPALAYAGSLAPSSDGPIMAFVSVYPLTMILRLFTAQALVLFFS